MSKDCNKTDWLDAVFAIKNRVITSLLATLVITLLAPITSAVANGSTPELDEVSIREIEGVTPPVAGATPVQFITPNHDEYTGEVFWSNIDGDLESDDNFQSLTIYRAEILITPKSGFKLDEANENFFTVAGASNVRTEYFLEDDIFKGVVTAIFTPEAGDAADYLDEDFGTDGSLKIKDFFGEAPLNDSNTAVGPIKVDRIAVDSRDRIVVLASFYDENDIDNHILFRLNADGSYDNRFGVGGPSLRKVEGDTPKSHVLVTTTGRCYSFSEKVDLEIVSLDKILVLLSGTDVEGDCFGDYHNFVARYDSDGTIDTTFSDDGVIGSLEPRSDNFPESLFSDFTVDTLGRITVASLLGDTPFEVVINRFDSFGMPDDDFCADYIDPIDTENQCYPGTAYVPIGSPATSTLTSESDPEPTWFNYRTLQIIADGVNGYVIAYTGPISESFGGIFSQLIRLENDGQVDPSFEPPADILFLGDEYIGDEYILPDFFVTDLAPDLAPDGSSGFLMSGTFLRDLDPESFAGYMIRINLDGSFDNHFLGTSVNPESRYLSPLISSGCFNTALLGNDVVRQSSIGIITGNLCVEGSSVKAFSPLGSFRGEVLIQQLTDETGTPNFIVNQLEGTSTGKILALSGTRPTRGAFGFLFALGVPGDSAPDWTEATITRYQLPDLLIALPDEPLGITGPERVVGVVGIPINPESFDIAGGTGTETITVTSGYALPAGLTLSSAGLISGTPTAAGTTTTSFTVTDSSNETLTAYIEFVFTLDGRPSAPTPPPAPTPVPYLTTLTTPKLNLKDGKLICTPGTYNAGYTLNGVAQGSTTALFTPSTFTYNLLINGIAQTSLTVTSNNSSHSWIMPTASAGALLTCSVTVTANGVTNTDRSSDNATAITTASLTHSNSLATAIADYSAALAANTKAYQKALVDNRAQWRSTTEKIRTDYYAERDRIKSLPPTKATRALSSAALKNYTTAIKKGAADYKASQPAALTAKEATDKAALDAKTAAIARANAAYGTAIESIGYGVLIP